MKNIKYTKQQVMSGYYSDEELKDMMKMSTERTLKWLEAARRFVGEITPQKTKKIQEAMAQEGW